MSTYSLIKIFSSRNADGTINLWDLVYKRPVESVTAHKGSSVLFAKILRDGKLLRQVFTVVRITLRYLELIFCLL